MTLHKKVDVSVLMATYNTPFVMARRAIDSVLNQDFQNFELIICDDGSDAGASRQLLNYARLYDCKIRYYKHENMGQSFAINKAIPMSNGRYVTIIDADDEYKTNHLSTCINTIEGADLIATHTETIVNGFEDFFVPDKNNTGKNIHVDDCILFATLFGKKEVFINIGFKKMYSADSEFYEQAAKKYVVKKMPSRTYIYYRNHPHSITGALKKQRPGLS